MKWTESLFIRNAKLYATVLDSQWKNGQEHAKLLSSLFREKGLKKGRVIDIPCGIGRVSVPLAKLGYDVTGVDFSPYFVKTAKHKAKQFGVTRRTEFSVGRMKDVGSLFPEGEFDAALNIFTSIGFGSEADDLSFFRGLRRVVRKGGLFVIGRLASRDFILTHFCGNLYDETDDLVVLQKNKLDVEHSRMKSEWRLYRKLKGSLRYAASSTVDLRLYSPHELVGMLDETGWKVSAIYDSLGNRRSYSPENPGMTLVAEAR
jgi:ubiquinone/menaquinone biosynthesis C-methylase UbiE